ncbi:hypothetical protein FAUST_11047 [Fusarium austroamericanum]|uniref:PNPLA domain-containing protein n=1 Tax=Fusarium austroamericanum TaxID=282268 RepID=A0AAN6BUQ0_FUSAU|nr:hypothetical protein FAUST_11047 [Fusarium austroamericanum]
MAARLSEMMITTFKTLDTEDDQNSVAPRFCSLVIPLVCSIMALDAARSFFPGKWVNIFCGENDQSTRGFWGSNKNSYKLQIAEAFDVFTSTSLKCEYRGDSGVPCVNRYASHQCHQNDKGEVIGPGYYDSQLLDELVIQWENSLYSRLNALDNEIDSQDTRQARRNATWRMHREAVEGLYSVVKTLENADLMMCSWCFCNDSSEFLACGHGICNACLAEIAIPSGMDQRLKVVESCSLHTPWRLFEPPLHFFQLPVQIGPRILSLDGDSGHEVIQTAILKDVENHFGRQIPIRHFFDLIGGSGTGGLLAIGIGQGNWGLGESATSLLNLQRDSYGRMPNDAIKKVFGGDFKSQRIIGSRVSTKRKGNI